MDKQVKDQLDRIEKQVAAAQGPVRLDWRHDGPFLFLDGHEDCKACGLTVGSEDIKLATGPLCAVDVAQARRVQQLSDADRLYELGESLLEELRSITQLIRQYLKESKNPVRQ